MRLGATIFPRFPKNSMIVFAFFSCLFPNKSVLSDVPVTEVQKTSCEEAYYFFKKPTPYVFETTRPLWESRF